MTQSQPAPEFRYWAFISYSHKDTSWGSWLHKALETYRVPKRLVGMPVAAGKIPARLTPIFRDRDELPTASDLGSAIEEALRQSWSLIVICSPGSAESRWVNEEVLAFQRLGRGERIHCLIVESGSDVAAPLVFPPALGSRAPTVDGRAGEPIAADARPFGDGRSGAKLKLIAGILGIGYDTLVQREHQRRHRNLFTVTCAALALVVVLAVSTVVAITSRRDAVNQRGHAENLVEFMIGDLRKKLEPDGKLATLDAVGKEALAYYASQKSEDLDADGLARRARALHMIGEVYDLRGELDEALKVFEQAADSTKELLERDPDNGQRVFDHAQSVYWVGYIAYQRGDAATAEPAFQEYKRLAEQLVALDPDNADWQAELGYANSNLGTLLYKQGRLADAEVIFRQELNAAQTSGEHAPQSYPRQLRTAQAHAWLSSVQYRLGKFEAMISSRKSEVAIYTNALTIAPNNNDARDGLAVAYRALADAHSSLGNVREALDDIRESAAQVSELIRADPENSRSIERASATYATFAQLLNSSNNHAVAVQANQRAQTLASELVAKDSSVLDWQIRSITSQIVSAELASSSGAHDVSLERATEAIAQIENLPETGYKTGDRLNPLVAALKVVAEESMSTNRTADAKNAWLRIVEIAESEEGQTLGPATRATLVLALLQLDREIEAKPIANELHAIGYGEQDYLRRTDLHATKPGQIETTGNQKPSHLPASGRNE